MMKNRQTFALSFVVVGAFLIACDEEDSGCSQFEETYTSAIFVHEPTDWVNSDGSLVGDDCEDYCPEADSLVSCGGATVEILDAGRRLPDEVLGGSPGVGGGGAMGGAAQVWMINTECTHKTLGSCADAEID